MKKFYIVAAAAIALVSCSSNNEVSDLEKPVKIVDATISVGMSEPITRAYLGTVTEKNGSYTINHSFEEKDKMYITDYSGQYPFTVLEDGQTTNITGRWAEIDQENTSRNGILATFPASAVKSKVTVSDNKPTMYFKLATEQTPYIFTGGDKYQISYDRKAGLAFACADNKNQTIWFLPVVSYLYFYSKEATCTITSDVAIAGDYTVTYSGSYGTGTNYDGTTYNSAEGLSQFLSYTATAKSITCHGVVIEDHQNKFDNFEGKGYEYIIAVKPGTYAAKSISIKPNGAEKSCKLPDIDMIPSSLYFVGCVDASASAN